MQDGVFQTLIDIVFCKRDINQEYPEWRKEVDTWCSFQFSKDSFDEATFILNETSATIP